MSAGECAFDMAEKLAFKECFGNGAHIDGHHRMTITCRQPVNLACNHFFSRAVLARDQNIGIGIRHFFREHAQLLHRFAVAPKHAACLGGGGGRYSFVLQRAGPESRLQGFGQFVVVPGFDNEVRSAFFDASHGQLDIGVCRKEYNLYRGVDLLDPGEPEKAFIPAVDPCTEVHIEQYHIHRFVVQNRSDAVGRGGCDYPGKLWSQQQFHGRKDALVVVDHENGTLSFRLVHAFSLKVDLPLKRLFK